MILNGSCVFPFEYHGRRLKRALPLNSILEPVSENK